MPEVIFTGPAGRIEGRYHPARQKNAPIAIVLHPHPQFGGTIEMKPSISGRRISNCMPIQAPNEKPAIQQEPAFGL